MIKVWIKTTWTDRDGWQITFTVDGVGVTASKAFYKAKQRTQAFYDDCKWAHNFSDVRDELISVEEI